jgi:PAS domain S-box-containing protein
MKTNAEKTTPTGIASRTEFLRERARERLETTTVLPTGMTAEETHRLIHELQVHQIELEIQNDELRKNQVELEASRTQYSDLYDFAPNGYLTLDRRGIIREANLTASRQLNVERSQLVNSPIARYISEEDRDKIHKHLYGILKSQKRQTCEVRLRKRSGGPIWALFDSILIQDGSPNELFRTSVTDISDHKRTAKALQTSHNFLKIANRHQEMKALLAEFITEIKDFTGCRSIGIRILDEAGNIPFAAYEGFSPEFYELESPLSIHSDRCMCINVIKGTTDASLPFYTEYGSFFLNNTTRFLASVSETEKGKTRNMCNRYGYESVALIPIRFNHRISGLIHVADRQENKVSHDIVELLEMLAIQINAAIERVQTREQLQKAHNELEQQVQQRTAELTTANKKLRRQIKQVTHTQDMLTRERDKFMSILESMEDGVCIVSQQYKIEYINPVLERGFGAIKGRNCYAYFHDLKEPCSWCKNQQVFAGKTARSVWYSDKNRRTYDLFDTPLKNADGTVYRLEIFRDISEHKRVEAALRQSDEQYRMLFNKANDAIFLVEYTSDLIPDGFIEVNEVACRTLGYSRQELLSMAPDEIVDPEYRVHIKDLRRKIFTEKHLIFELLLVSKSGQKIPMEFNAHSFKYKWRPAILAIARNIVERKRAEETLRASEEKFRMLSQEFDALLNAIPDSLMLIGPDLKIRWANAMASHALNRKVSDLTGHCCYSVSENSAARCKECPAVRSFRSGQAETQISTLNGKVLDERAFPLKDGERVTNVILITRDITERTTLEAEAMQASHLAALGELAAGVAHEINNPINGIINYAQILLNKSNKESMANDFGQLIIEESDRIANIVSSLLSFARGGQDGKRPAHIDKVLADTLTLTQSQLRKEGIHLTTDIPPDLPQVVINVHLIQQVFLNIINNARYALNLKYPTSHDGKLIKIGGEELLIEGCPHIRITFYDQGIGIAADILAKIKNPFFSTKPSGRGTGLGLTLSHNIIADHDGKLWVESVENEFTKVALELPGRIFQDEGQNSSNR